jgi:hypothetical protein
MVKLILLSIFCLSFSYSTAQVTQYYVAAGKDSITYLATNKGLAVLKRDTTGALSFLAEVNDSNKVYTRALDNDNFLIMWDGNKLDLFSLENIEMPLYLGSLNSIYGIISIRPFGEHFAIIRTGQHYIVGVRNGEPGIIDTVNSSSNSYTGRTAFYPEVVYPYFFAVKSGSIVVYKFDETLDKFNQVKTIPFTADHTFVQMYGGGNRLYTIEKNNSYSNPYWLTKKSYVVESSVTLLNESTVIQNIPFTDEIECTSELIRFNGWYKTLTGTSLTEPNQYLFAYANLSGRNIYNTNAGVNNPTNMYYSTKIEGTVINSALYTGMIVSVDQDRGVSSGYILEQNYPNPFNPSTKIKYTLAERSPVTLRIYDLLGRELATLVDEVQGEGNYESYLNAGELGLSSGIYLYRLVTSEFSNTRKMIYLK